jgi:hypothetical protein
MVSLQLLDVMQDIYYNNDTGMCIGACLLEWGWGQECQRLPNFGSGLQLVPRRLVFGLQKTLGLVLRPTRNLRRRALLILYDMQQLSKMIFEFKNLHHNKVAIQQSQHT